MSWKKGNLFRVFGVMPSRGGSKRQRVSLAAAWLGSPPLLILDEPTNGLDDATQKELAVRLSTASAIVATHDRAFARAVVTRVLTLRAGSLAPEVI